MGHAAKRRDDSGEYLKIIPKFTLPLSGISAVDCNLIDLGVFDITAESLNGRELAKEFRYYLKSADDVQYCFCLLLHTALILTALLKRILCVQILLNGLFLQWL